MTPGPEPRRATRPPPRSLQRRLSVAIVTLVVAALGVAVAASYLATRQVLRARFERELRTAAALAASGITAPLAALLTDMEMLSQNAVVTNAMVDSRDRALYMGPLLADYCQLRRGHLLRLSLVDFTGALLATSDPSREEGYTREPWVEGVVEGGAPYAAQRPHAARPLLVVAQPVVLPGTGRAEGALVAEVDLRALFDARPRIDAPDVHVRLLAADGAAIAGDPVAWDGLATARHVVGGHPVLQALAFRVEIGTPLGSLFRVFRWLAVGYATGSVLLLAAALATARRVAIRTALPIRSLAAAAGDIAATGSYRGRVPVTGDDEIARLAAAFNDMLARLEAASDAAVAEQVAGRRRAEASRVAANEYQAMLLENMYDAVIGFDADLVVNAWNRASERVFGWSREEAIGRRLASLMESDYGEGTSLEEHVAAIAREGRKKLDVRRRTRGGEWREFECTSAALRDAEGALLGYVSVNHDVTARNRAETQLRQAQKMEAIGRLAGGIAHDFNNLLTVILSCADALRADLAAGAPPQGEDVDEIRAAGERARDLTRRLLAFARKGVAAPTTLDLGEVVEASVRLLQRVLGEDIVLAVTSQPDLWPVHCDRSQLEQVILNLAVNARDAMPHGGTLTLATSNLEVRDGDPRLAAFPGMAPGDYVRLTVSDTGTGMPPEVKARLFEPFFTTKEVGKGTGLGLATVYGIVKDGEGFIGVESAPGRGSTFEICLPRRSGEDASHAPSSAPATHAGARGRPTECVLVVDDDPSVRRITTRALRQAGYRVLVAEDGSAALEVARREAGRIDLLLTDIVMPGLDGCSLHERLLRERPGLRVLYMSGYPGDAIAQRGLGDARVQLLQKPFTAPTLLDRVRALVAAAPGEAAPLEAAPRRACGE